jgi:branched-chain amino acid aminotransferase
MKALKMNAVEELSKDYFQSYISKLLNKNRIFKGARMRLTVYRDYGGFYTPEKNSVSWVLESSALESEKYALNKKGLTVDIFDDVHKPVNKLSNLKTTNSLIYVLAGLYRSENNLGECFVLNQYGRIAECISSNVFLVFKSKIVTPPLTEGCISGIMREVIMDIISAEKIKLEERPVLEKELAEAEEIFITNSIQGIQWISAYKDRRYFNFVARKLLPEINKMI